MRVAMVLNTITSTVNSSLEVARRLTAAGHTVTLISHGDIGPTADANGLRSVRLTADQKAFDSVRAALDVLRHGSVGARIRSAVKLPWTVRSARSLTAQATELTEAICTLEPDVVLIDIEAHLAVVASARFAVPVALMTSYFGLAQRPGVPPTDSWLGPDDQRAIDAAWDDQHVAARRAARARRWSRLGMIDRFGPISYSTSSRTALSTIARSSGFDLSTSTDVDQWLRPHGYVGIPVMSANLEELEFGSGGQPPWTYVGPMVRAARVDVDSDDHAALAWQQVRTRLTEEPDRAIVYCSLGSYWASDMRLLESIIAAAAQRPAIELVVGLGRRGDVTKFSDVAPNVHILRWAPQVEILGTAQAAIIHGGNAGLNECVWFGVPMLVCSTGHLDQNGVAARVAHHGIGVACDGQTATADEIGALLDRVLADDTIRERVRALSATARLPERVDAVIDFVEDVGAISPQRSQTDRRTPDEPASSPTPFPKDDP